MDDDTVVAHITTGLEFIHLGRPLQVAARAELCRGPASGIQFLARRHALAYACKNGAVGLWDPDTQETCSSSDCCITSR